MMCGDPVMATAVLSPVLSGERSPAGKMVVRLEQAGTRFLSPE